MAWCTRSRLIVFLEFLKVLAYRFLRRKVDYLPVGCGYAKLTLVVNDG